MSVPHWLRRIPAWASKRVSILGRSPWFNLFWSPLIGFVPSVFITLYYGNSVAASHVAGIAPTIDKWMTGHAWSMALFAGLWTPVLVGAAKAIHKRVQPPVPEVDSLLSLLGALDAVVGAKLNRFSEHFRHRDELTKETAFEVITQPKSQIAEIVRGICQYFNLLQPPENRALIRVTLAIIENGTVNGVPIFYPQDRPVSNLEVFAGPDSAVNVARRTRRILIIEDIEKEIARGERKRRFAPSGNHEDDKGSIICYPVHHAASNSIPFVVSIHCTQHGFFKESHPAVHDITLRRFALRLCLEYSLLVLKENLCGPNGSQD